MCSGRRWTSADRLWVEVAGSEALQCEARRRLGGPLGLTQTGLVRAGALRAVRVGFLTTAEGERLGGGLGGRIEGTGAGAGVTEARHNVIYREKLLSHAVPQGCFRTTQTAAADIRRERADQSSASRLVPDSPRRT